MSKLNLEKEPVEASKKGFDFNRYMQQLQQMDPNNIGAWPTAVKVTMYILILLIIATVAYFALIKGLQEEIANAEAENQNLLTEFKDKDSKLRNLTLYEEQIKLMEAQFNEQLQQLPKETEIPGLVQDINTAGVASDLEFKNISLLSEVQQEIFIEQPIDITVIGGYHSMGGFVTAIAALPRIVTLHDFTIKTVEQDPKKFSTKLIMNINAKTYRYMDKKPDAVSKDPNAPASSDSAKPASGAK
ncbi:type 4a pilus biogenesis protein PilO [Acinetobacter sp. c3-l95]|uniref:type 4a pilus biogenesis protein PilO n=1 Tax=Acinetobacter sp. c3-l95 TaxID=3342804 RepID=UPI0035B9C26E